MPSNIVRRYGMPERVIAFAREMVGNAGAEFTSLLADLRRRRDELAEAQREVGRQQEWCVDKQQEVEARAGAIEAARREASDKAGSVKRDSISATRRQMNELLDEFKREKRSETIEKLRRSEAELTGQLKPRTSERHDPFTLKEVKAGDAVHVSSLGHDGVVVSVDPRLAKARVRTGSMELDVGVGDLAVPHRPGGEKARHPTSGRLESGAGRRTRERELKLIGLRVDDALDLLEPFLNHASLNGLSEVRIIHGVGTGRLRDAVREHLARHPLVEEFRAGGPHEGERRHGGAFTAVRIVPAA